MKYRIHIDFFYSALLKFSGPNKQNDSPRGGAVLWRNLNAEIPENVVE
jgi:hypothetical protein